MNQKNNSKTYRLRIHGDNILECESALSLLAASVNPNDPIFSFVGGQAFTPIYKVISDTNISFFIQLFPGHDRWGIDLKKHLMDRGAPLREATDAIITRLNSSADGEYEEPILALEFCGALPAGNNAWQRSGRALAMAYAQVPYLYFAEIGGLELGLARDKKAARFPNPLVPFAYLTLGEIEGAIALPVFVSSPSIGADNYRDFKDCFGLKDATQLVRGVLFNTNLKEYISSLQSKSRNVVKILAEKRKRNDILSPDEFESVEKMRTGFDKAGWLIKKGMSWNKKIGLKTITKTFKKLLKITIQQGAVGAGSKDMPFCLLDGNRRMAYAKEIGKLYGKSINSEFLNWLSDGERPLLCVWIAGFKPRGDDSRPDRGLVPLARMIFGNEKIDLLTIVYGPAKSDVWKKLQEDMYHLSRTNGLWEAIVNLSNAILVDSPTSLGIENRGLLVPQNKKVMEPEILRAAKLTPSFGEHDIDSVIHLLCARSLNEDVYEGLCNPPGGDWSGISIIDFDEKREYRWTSLPRVSGDKTKRPDHLIQFRSGNTLVAIESKASESLLETNIGNHLRSYIGNLIKRPPISTRKLGEELWEPFSDKLSKKCQVLSGAAFRFSDKKRLQQVLKKGKLNMVFGVDYSPERDFVIIYTIFDDQAEQFLPTIKKLTHRYSNAIELRVIRASNSGR
ncbi:MAG: hypothetical protein U9R38_05165 [Candidatus Margulisiibacteriota bacterium]|nr:hypothetical protein [Candidatus Margulisiibacteriota bacterium]